MGFFQGKIYRCLLLTGVTYTTLSFLAASSPGDVVRIPTANPGLEGNIEQGIPSDSRGLEGTIEQKEIKQSPGEPSDKYGPKWQEEIRRNYRTEFV